MAYEWWVEVTSTHMPGSYDVPWCFGSTRLVSSLKLLSIYLIYSRQLFLDCISLWGYIYQNDAANRASQSEKFMTSWWEASTTTQPQQPACASLLLIQVPQHLVQQKGDQLAYLKKEESLLWERRNKSYFYYWKWWERKKVPTSLSDGAGPYISDGYLLVRIPKILIQILLIEK